MKESKSLFANSILYTAGNLMLKAFSFFLIPLYTSYLSTEAYGLVNLASGFYTVAAALLTLSLGAALTRFYAEYRESKEQIASMISSVITFLLGLGAVFLLLSVVLGDLVSQLFFEGIDFFPLAFLSVIIAGASAIYTVYQELLKGMQDAKRSMALSYTYFFLLLGCNIVSVMVLEQGALGVIASTTLVNVVMVALMFIDLKRRKLLTLGIQWPMLKRLLGYSLPLVPHTMAYNVSNYATKLIIADKLSLSMLGIYSLASQFGNIADVVLNSVQSAFQPWFFRTMREKKEGNDPAAVVYKLMWLYGLLFLGLAAFSQEVVIILADESYGTAWTYIPAVVIAIALKAPLYFYNSCMYFDTTKTKYIFVSTLIGSITNILLTLLLVPHLQVYGSILADIAAMALRLAVVLLVLPKEIRSIFSFWRLMMHSGISILFIIAAVIPAFMVFTTDLSLINFLYKCCVILGYCAIALLVNRKGVSSYINRLRKRG